MSQMLAVAEHPVPCDISVAAVDRAARRPLIRLVGLASITVKTSKQKKSKIEKP